MLVPIQCSILDRIQLCLLLSATLLESIGKGMRELPPRNKLWYQQEDLLNVPRRLWIRLYPIYLRKISEGGRILG